VEAVTPAPPPDPIALANAKAKGKRPYFFRDPDVERVLSIAMAIAMEHAVTRQRLDALERLVEAKGLATRAELDAWTPGPEAEAERTRWMKEYVARVLRIVQQETEAAERSASGTDQPMEQVMDELRHS
jgi:hypothetical protein